MYINDSHHIQRTYNQLKIDYPNTSLPRNNTPVIMVDWYYIVDTPRPTYNPYTQKLEEQNPTKIADVYHQVWSVVALEASEVAAILLSAKEGKYEDVWKEASSRNQASEEQFDNDANTPEGNTNRNAKQWTKISNKKAKSQTLSAAEKKFDDNYDSMLDYQNTVNDAADQGEDTVEAMTSTANVVAYDPVGDPSWPPVWVKPA